jgi:two-component system, OmpR family, sensor kinase
MRQRLFASARSRILASYIVLLLFSTVLSTVALTELLQSRAGERIDEALIQETEEFRRLAQDGRDPRTGRPFGNDVRAIFDVFLSRNVPGEGEAFYTFVSSRPYEERFAPGLETIRAAEIDALASTTSSQGGEAEVTDGRRIRYIVVPVGAGDRATGTFAVALDLTGELDEVNDALRLAAAVGIGVLFLASLLAWAVAGRVLAPLRVLRDTARSISESDLTRRIPVRGDDELADLARSFNEMVDRLEEAFASQKSFISDAGHELRTPITIIRGHLDVMGDDPKDREETLELVGDELDRMGRLVNDLLLLAKASRPDFLQPETIDIEDLTNELFAKASALAPRDWRLGDVGSGRIVADRQRLTQAVMNLSQNAATHTGEGDAIELGSTVVNERAELWVKDTGPGIPPDAQEHIFDRFARLQRTGEGAGLGLAITVAIAEAHGGGVKVDSRRGAGAQFTISIPIEPPQEVLRT